MTHLVQTSTPIEGGDELREFLVEYADELKLTNPTKLNEMYDKLQQDPDIGYDGLLVFSIEDLRKSLTECNLKSSQIGRIISVLKGIPESVIYKEANSSKEIVHIVISEEEEKALQDIKNKTAKIDNILKMIDNEMSEISENAQNNKQFITDSFIEIRNKINQKEQYLLTELQTKIHAKTQNLNDKTEEFIEYKNELNECYTKSQSLINDTLIDKNKRKIQISTISSAIVNKPNTPNVDDFTIIKSKIITSIDINKVSNTLAATGTIEDIAFAQPPDIDITSIQQRCAILQVSGDNALFITQYKLQYAEYDDIKSINDEDDMKINWISKSIKNQKELNEVIIKPLEPATNYILRGLSKNQIGWGSPSKYISFSTKQKEREYFKIFNSEKIKLNDDKCTLKNISYVDSTIYGAMQIDSMSKTVHHWKIKRIKGGVGIGIDETKYMAINDCVGFKAYNKTKSYGIWPDGHKYSWKLTDFEKFHLQYKDNDVVDMILDLRKCTLSYCINGGLPLIAFNDVAIGEDITYCMILCFDGWKGAQTSLIEYENNIELTYLSNQIDSSDDEVP